MSQHSSPEHGGPHLSPPSYWPPIVGIAALAVALTLLFWTRDRSNSFAGPAFGAAILFALVAVAGWATEDSRMKRRKEAMERETIREARYTQVVTFAIAEGRLEEAQASGILAAVERSDSALRDLAGFQDLRIIAAPADSGPSQVLVETTWSGREGLATYEETRQTMLDLIADYPDEVLPGSAQIFDMQVVRDTKDVSFRFSLGAATAMFSALIVGGLLVGAGLTAFQKSTPAATSTPPPATTSPGGSATPSATSGPASTTINLVAKDIKFDLSTITIPAGQKITLHFTNDDSVPHNFALLTKKGGTAIFTGQIFPGPNVTKTETFTAPSTPGTYYFQCDVHPTLMYGTVIVTPASSPGSATASSTASATGTAAPSGTTINLVAKNIKFDLSTITIPAGQKITLHFTNDDAVPHNFALLTKKGGTALFTGQIFSGPNVTKTETFTAPSTPGTYYFQCDVHPTLMFGTVVVK